MEKMPAALSKLRPSAPGANQTSEREDFGMKADVLGETGGEQVEITIDGLPAISASVAELRAAYEGALEKALRTEAGVESEMEFRRETTNSERRTANDECQTD